MSHSIRRLSTMPVSPFTPEDRDDYDRHKSIVRKTEESALAFVHSCGVIKERKLYLLECRSWEEFCEKELPHTRRSIDRLLSAAKQLPWLAERHARELRRLPEQEREPAYRDASDLANLEGFDQPEQRHIQQVVKERRRKAKPENDGATMDECGTIVTDGRIAAAFNAADPFGEALNLVGQLKTIVDDLVTTPAGLLLAENQQVIERDRRSLAALIRFCRPHAVCPYCGGRQEKCDACKGRGWVNEDIYRTSPAAKDHQRTTEGAA